MEKLANLFAKLINDKKNMKRVLDYFYILLVANKEKQKRIIDYNKLVSTKGI